MNLIPLFKEFEEAVGLVETDGNVRVPILTGAGGKWKLRGSATVRSSQDCKEGFSAFLEKRKPVFTGR
jgi:enoyl-CoA hydratase/carnithine racemase